MMASMPPKVLVLARWYPSHDVPLRSQFVLDHIRVLRELGAEVAVAAAEYVPLQGPSETLAQRAAKVQAFWTPFATMPAAISRPTSWGLSGVPVARPPVIVSWPAVPGLLIDNSVTALEGLAAALHETWGFDAIHAHTGYPDGIASAAIAERLRLPLIVTEHESRIAERLSDASVRRRYLRLVDGHCVVAVSRFQAWRLAGALGIEPARIRVVPNPVDVDAFTAAPLSQRDSNELVCAGARKASKGIERLLRAFALVQADRPSLHLRLIGPPGEPEDETTWQTLTARLGLKDAVSIEPVMAREPLAAVMSRAWIFVHPSSLETFGVVAAEALASGLPVAASPSGGLDELLGDDGRLGEVAGGMTSEALADAIRRLLERRVSLDPAELRRHAVETWSLPVVAARTLALYRELGVKGADRGVGATPRRAPGPVATAPADGAPGPAGPVALPLVIGLNLGAARRAIAALPPDLATRLTILTLAAGHHKAKKEPAPPAAPGTWHVRDGDASFRKALAAIGGPGPRRNSARWWLSALSSPRCMVRRYRLSRRRAAMRRDTVRSLLVDEWRKATAERGGNPPLLLPIGSGDVLAIAQARTKGMRLTPGGLRWLADAFDAGQIAAAAPSGAQESQPPPEGQPSPASVARRAIP